MKRLKCFLCKKWWVQKDCAEIMTYFGTKDFQAWICPECFEKLSFKRELYPYIFIERLRK